MADPATESYRIVGKYCESGDVLVNEAILPALEHGDLLVMPMVGAYAPAMASNYNMAYKPAAVMVNEGDARVIRRRESFEDLIRLES
jgi:diaminopimelate decarboxylase